MILVAYNLNDITYPTGNTTSTTFPLFTQQMYSALTYKWANTIFAFIATIMIPIPFVGHSSPPYDAFSNANRLYNGRDCALAQAPIRLPRGRVAK